MTPMDTDQAATELLLQQICDSVFPIGAYSQSYGLETYIQLGLITDAEGAWGFLRGQIEYPLTYTELLGMRLAYGGALEAARPGGSWDAVADLEAELAALKTPAETRAASEKLASRFIRTVTSIGALGPGAAERFSAYVRTGAPHAVNAAYGAFAALAGIDLEALLRRYLYGQVSAMTVNCVKSVPLSQTAGQGMLFRSLPLQERAVERALAADRADLGLSMPGFDVRCIEHEGVYSRLYMS